MLGRELPEAKDVCLFLHIVYISAIVRAQHVSTAQAMQDEGLGAGKSISEDELKQRKSSAVRSWMVSMHCMTLFAEIQLVSLP